MGNKSLEQQHSEATYAILQVVLRLLHEREILPLQDVVSRLESQQYSLVAGHDFAPNPCLQVLIDQLQQLADAYPQPKPPSDAPRPP